MNFDEDTLLLLLALRICETVFLFQLPFKKRKIRGLTCGFSGNRKSALILEITGRDYVHSWIKFSIQNVVFRVSRRKNSKYSLLRELFFLIF